MKKKLFSVFAFAAFAFAATAAITTAYTYKPVYAGGQLAEGAAVTNTVDTAKGYGVATFVVPYTLDEGGRLEVEFAGAYTNGAAFVSCPTNDAALLASYTITNGSIFTVSYPVQYVPGRFLRVILKSAAGTNSAAAVWAAHTRE